MPADPATLVVARVGSLLRAGEVVNLGIGLPLRVAGALRPDSGVWLQSENGVLGVAALDGACEDPHLVDAGKRPVAVRRGASFASSAESFGMIRGGRVDTAVLGVLEVSGDGELANWALPGRPVLGVGGAMDLLCGAGRVIAATRLSARDGSAKLVERLSLPATGSRRVDLVATELSLLRPSPAGFVVLELAPGASLEELRARVAAPLVLDGDPAPWGTIR